MESLGLPFILRLWTLFQMDFAFIRKKGREKRIWKDYHKNPAEDGDHVV